VVDEIPAGLEPVKWLYQHLLQTAAEKLQAVRAADSKDVEQLARTASSAASSSPHRPCTALLTLPLPAYTLPPQNALM
jgi:hypothetical protein